MYRNIAIKENLKAGMLEGLDAGKLENLKR